MSLNDFACGLKESDADMPLPGSSPLNLSLPLAERVWSVYHSRPLRAPLEGLLSQWRQVVISA